MNANVLEPPHVQDLFIFIHIMLSMKVDPWSQRISYLCLYINPFGMLIDLHFLSQSR